jgi:hypothetical protein
VTDPLTRQFWGWNCHTGTLVSTQSRLLGCFGTLRHNVTRKLRGLMSAQRLSSEILALPALIVLKRLIQNQTTGREGFKHVASRAS